MITKNEILLTRNKSYKKFNHIGTLDFKTDAKKEGYKKAALIYKEIYEELRLQCRQLNKLIKKRMKFQDSLFEILEQKIKELSDEKKELEKLLMEKRRLLFNRWKIPASYVNPITKPNDSFSLKPLYEFIKMRWNKNVEDGYREAVSVYKDKIQELQQSVDDTIKEQKVKYQGTLMELSRLFKDIIDLKTQIADITFLLQEK